MNFIRMITICLLVCFGLFPYAARGSVSPPPRDAVAHDKTNFPLVGKHRTLSCDECHPREVNAGTPTACEACHWVRKQDDPYRLRLGIHCGDCHTPADWKTLIPGSWSHEAVSAFKPGGIHKIMDCNRCHTGGTFTGPGIDCIDCHREEYRETENPDHGAAQFPEDCLQCHNMVTWEGAQYNHPTFPLSGMHRTADCADCHRNNRYHGLSDQCVTCHQDDYNATTSPNHVQVGYSVHCEKCHDSGATGWHGATFDHDRFWPLRGLHRLQDCNVCHAGGYGISGECISCHRAEYDNTREPDHREAGFHTDCEQCHPAGAGSWTQTVFDHPFPIYSGKHGHLSCGDCHRTANFFLFTCTDCHAHDREPMNAKHTGVTGYTYADGACYACHPSGER